MFSLIKKYIMSAVGLVVVWLSAQVMWYKWKKGKLEGEVDDLTQKHINELNDEHIKSFEAINKETKELYDALNDSFVESIKPNSIYSL